MLEYVYVLHNAVSVPYSQAATAAYEWHRPLDEESGDSFVRQVPCIYNVMMKA